MIDGNIKALIQVKKQGTTNEIGENESVWTNKCVLEGWLDLSNGTASYNNYNAKIQESTHIFICDYVDLTGVKTENSRLIVDDKLYEITFVDDPMELHQQLEIYLKFVGGQNG